MAGILSGIDAAYSGMEVQATRLSTVSSNLANIDSAASSADAAYKALFPVFMPENVGSSEAAKGVTVTEIKESNLPARPSYEPSNPLANEQGYVFYSSVSREEIIADMTSASESYKANLANVGLLNGLMDKTIKAME